MRLGFAIGLLVTSFGLRSTFGQEPGTKLWEFVSGGPVVSSPAVGGDGTIYFGSNDRKLYALNPDGTKKWEFRTGNSVQSSPAIGPDGTVYFGSRDRNLYALNPDGTLRWKFETDGGISSSPAVGPDGNIYVGSSDHKVYAIDSEGFLFWEFDVGGDVLGSPAVGGDGIVYVGGGTNFVAVQSNGTAKWSFGASDAFNSSPAIGEDGTIYVGNQNHKLYALTAAGAKKWESQTGSDIPASPCLGPNGVIFIGSSDDRLYAIRTNSFQKWRIPTGGAIQSSAAVAADGTVYVGSNDRRVYAITPFGTTNWTFLAGSDIRSSPAIAPDGTLYVGCNDGKLYALRGSSALGATAWPMHRGNLKHQASVASVSNAPLVLRPIPNQAVLEGRLLQFAVGVTDLQRRRLTYSLDAGAPAGASIHATNGLFTWTPTEAQGPATYQITVRVIDSAAPELVDFRVVSVAVQETNSAPILAPVTNRTVHAGSWVSFSLAATDPDLPPNVLTYSLVSGTVPGATVDPVTGAFTWLPGNESVGADATFVVRVSDNGTPVASDEKTFAVTVADALDVQSLMTNGMLRLAWKTIPGTAYQVQYKERLTDAGWIDYGSPVMTVGTSASVDEGLPGKVPSRFLRVVTAR